MITVARLGDESPNNGKQMKLSADTVAEYDQHVIFLGRSLCIKIELVRQIRVVVVWKVKVVTRPINDTAASFQIAVTK
jgi:hypothetical protein